MKGVSAPSPDRSIIVVKDGDGYELRVWNRMLGDAPIGARLARRDGLPDLPIKASNFHTAIDLQTRWQQWLDNNPLSNRKKKGKR